MSSTTLPFKLTHHSVSIWLQSLEKLNSVSSANQLYKVISLLKILEITPQDKLSIFRQIAPVALHVSSTIESIKKDNICPSDKEKKIQKLFIQLIRHLSLNFYALSSNTQLSGNEQNQALYISLQLIGHTQRITTIFHRIPSSMLWEITGKIYTLAYNKNILKENLNPDIQAFKKATSIESTLKRNLLFSIVSPYKYDTKQINILFSIARKYSHLLTLHSNHTLTTYFHWDSSRSNAPSIKQPSQLVQSHDIYFDTSLLVEKLKSPKFSAYLKKENLGRIIDELTGYDRITNAPVSSIFSINQMLMGITSISAYLEKTEKLKKIQELSFDPDYGKPSSFNPAEPEKNSASILPTIQNDDNQIIPDALSVKTLSLNNKNYTIVETNPIDCIINNIVLFCNSKPHPELGIIKQIKITQSSTSHILIEKLTGKPSSKKVILLDNTEYPAIYLQHSTASLFISPYEHSIKIKTEQEKNLVAVDLIEHTSSYMEYLTHNSS